jgi:hypothetical protein
MTSGHPSETELQQYASDPSDCSLEAIRHIEICEKCLASAGLYQLLFTEIKEAPKPVFDFSLSDLVLAKLPLHPASGDPEVSRFGFSAWVLTFLSCCTIAIPLYLFRKNIWNMFEGISTVFMLIILVASALVVLVRTMGIYRKYREQMRILNYY